MARHQRLLSPLEHNVYVLSETQSTNAQLAKRAACDWAEGFEQVIKHARIGFNEMIVILAIASKRGKVKENVRKLLLILSSYFRAATNSSIVRECFVISAKFGFIDLMSHFQILGSGSVNVPMGFCAAARNGQLRSMQWIRKEFKLSPVNYSDALINAIEGGGNDGGQLRAVALLCQWAGDKERSRMIETVNHVYLSRDKGIIDDLPNGISTGGSRCKAIALFVRTSSAAGSDSRNTAAMACAANGLSRTTMLLAKTKVWIRTFSNDLQTTPEFALYGALVFNRISLAKRIRKTFNDSIKYDNVLVQVMACVASSRIAKLLIKWGAKNLGEAGMAAGFNGNKESVKILQQLGAIVHVVVSKEYKPFRLVQRRPTLNTDYMFQ